jgi:hypothetical protein
MADASAVYTKSATKQVDVSERKVTYYGTVAIDAAPDTYDVAGLTLNLVSGTLQGGVPDEVRFYSANGWVYKYVAGTKITDGKIEIWGQEPTNAGAGALPLTELGAVAIPASVSGDTIEIIFTMRKGK